MLGIANNILKRLTFSFTSSGNLEFRFVEIAQIQPKVPKAKIIIINGKAAINRVGF